MLENWLQPAGRDIPASAFSMGGPSLGTSILQLEDFSRGKDSVEVALIGVHKQSADEVRKQLYSLASPERPEAVIDLGNCRKTSGNFIGPLLKELLQSGILPILLCEDQRLIATQFQAYRGNRRSINAVVVDEKIRFNPEEDDPATFPLNKLILQRNTHLFSLGLIGFQRHYISQKLLGQLEEGYHEHLRLGLARENLSLSEPLIRDADMMAIHLDALRASEMPGQLSPSPNGFSAEEACRLARYAGLNDKLTSIGFFGFHFREGEGTIGPQVIAQLIWYFLDGYFQRKNDFPKSTDGLVEYIIDASIVDDPIVFWKSSKSGRWWMQIPVKPRKKHARHRLVPCTYEDYLQASRGDFSDRLIHALKRFE
jgi:formiminoglutamase